MLAAVWLQLRALMLQPAEVLEGTLARQKFVLSLILGGMSYYESTLQIGELALPTHLANRGYLLINFPIALGRMALTVAVIHLSCRLILARTRPLWDLMGLWGYTQVPGILLTVLAVAFLASRTGAFSSKVQIVGVLLMVVLALLLSLWGLVLKLQALKVCYNAEGKSLLASIVLALILIGALTWVERVFLDDRGIVPQDALQAMASGAPSQSLGRRSLSLPFDSLTYRLRAPERQEVVGFAPLERTGLLALLPGFRLRVVARVVGLPGETVQVQQGRLIVNGRPLHEPYVASPGGIDVPPTEVPQAHFFLLADNREVPLQTYEGGVIAADRIRGRLTDVGRLKWRLVLGTWLW